MRTIPVLRGSTLFPIRRLPLSVRRGSQGPAPLHTHDFVEIVLVSRGKGAHERRPADFKQKSGTSYSNGAASAYEILANDVFVLAPWESHAYSQCECLEIYNLLFSPELVEGELEAAGSPSFFELFSAARPQGAVLGASYKLHLKLLQRQAVEGCLRAIMQELAGRQRGFEALAKAKLLELLVILDRAFVSRGVSARQPSEQLGKESAVYDAITFMEDQLSRPLRIESIAESVHLSPPYFCELFKATTGLSPGKYLMQLRLEQAKHLLLTTRLPITEIAGSCGFCDSSHFARAFKAGVQASPRGFRETGKLS